MVVRTTWLGRFMLLKEIGAVAWARCSPHTTNSLIARSLKILRKPKAGSERQRLQIVREARAAARISHPNVVSIYEVNEADGLIHIAMEYVEEKRYRSGRRKAVISGVTFLGMYLQSELLCKQPMTPMWCIVTSSQIMFSSVTMVVLVVDFGLARVGSEDLGLASSSEHAELRAMGRISMVGVIAGTLGYMSPEQYRRCNVDARSDQWSFCASLFEALYGVLPFAGKTMAEYAENVYGRPRTRPSNSLVPEEVHRAYFAGSTASLIRDFPFTVELMVLPIQRA